MVADEYPRRDHLRLCHLALPGGTAAIILEPIGSGHRPERCLGSSLSRALTGNAPLLPTLAATGLLVILNVGVTALAPRSKIISRLTKGRPITLVRNGEVDHEAFRKAHFGENDITELLRLNSLRDLSEVEEARLERNGQISVIPKSSA